MICNIGPQVSINYIGAIQGGDYSSDTSSSDDISASLQREFKLDMTTLEADENNTQSKQEKEYSGTYKTEINKIFSIILKMPLSIDVTINKDNCLFDCDELEIYEAGKDYHDAMINFCQFFSSDLEFWQSANDEELTEDAIILKEKYLSYA